METLIVYNRSSLDAIVSCALVYERNRGAEKIALDYDEPVNIKYLCSFKSVIMLGVSLDIDSLLELSCYTDLILIEGGENRCYKYNPRLVDFKPSTFIIYNESSEEKNSTIDFTYRYLNGFFPKKGCSDLLYEIGRYCVKDYCDNDILPIGKALELFVQRPSDYSETFDEYSRNRLVKIGNHIIYKEKREARQKSKFVERRFGCSDYAFLILGALKYKEEEDVFYIPEAKSFNFLVSNVGESACLKALEEEVYRNDKNIDFLCVWEKRADISTSLNRSLYSYRLYPGNNPDYDVSLVAKSFGGDGDRDFSYFTSSYYIFQ